jgi:hypothetical protein
VLLPCRTSAGRVQSLSATSTFSAGRQEPGKTEALIKYSRRQKAERGTQGIACQPPSNSALSPPKPLGHAEPQAGWSERLLIEGPQRRSSNGTSVNRHNCGDTKANSIFRRPACSTKRMAWLIVLKSKASSGLPVQASADWTYSPVGTLRSSVLITAFCPVFQVVPIRYPFYPGAHYDHGRTISSIGLITDAAVIFSPTKHCPVQIPSTVPARFPHDSGQSYARH